MTRASYWSYRSQKYKLMQHALQNVNMTWNIIIFYLFFFSKTFDQNILMHLMPLECQLLDYSFLLTITWLIVNPLILLENNLLFKVIKTPLGLVKLGMIRPFLPLPRNGTVLSHQARDRTNSFLLVSSIACHYLYIVTSYRLMYHISTYWYMT